MYIQAKINKEKIKQCKVAHVGDTFVRRVRRLVLLPELRPEKQTRNILKKKGENTRKVGGKGRTDLEIWGFEIDRPESEGGSHEDEEGGGRALGLASGGGGLLPLAGAAGGLEPATNNQAT